MLLNYHIGCIVLGLLCFGVRVRFGWGGIRVACSPDTTPAEPHPNSKTQQSKNNIANVVVPSSGVCDYVGELPHWLYCSWVAVFWS